MFLLHPRLIVSVLTVTLYVPCLYSEFHDDYAIDVEIPWHGGVEHSFLSMWDPWQAGVNSRGMGSLDTHFRWRTWMPTSLQAVAEHGPQSAQSVQ